MDPIYVIPPYEAAMSAVPFSEVQDWSLDFLGVSEGWKSTRGKINGKPLRVCVLDTGIDANHPDMQGAILDAADFTGSMWGPQDRVGHGTWCASMIAARAGNDVGVRGIAPECQILAAKVLGDNGSGTDASISKGIAWGFNKGADFFSLSLGGPAMSDKLRQLFAEIVRQAGKFVFAAAGNDGGRVNFPARWEELIAVGACDKNGDLVKFSCRGPELDIIAPGVDMLAAVPGGSYATMSGTSMATPVACAVGVLAYAKHQSAGGNTDLRTQVDMLSHLRRTAVKKGEFGLLNPKELFAEQLTPPVVPPPTTPDPAQGPPMVVSVQIMHGERMFAGTIPEVTPKR